MNDQLTGTILTVILIAAGLTADERAALAGKLSHAGTKSGDQAIAISSTMCILADKGIIRASDAAWNGLATLQDGHLAAMHDAHEMMTEIDHLSQALREHATVSA